MHEIILKCAWNPILLQSVHEITLKYAWNNVLLNVHEIMLKCARH